ncbi:MAG: nitrous oxide reductase family maturation protein NosD [Crocinitomicaceae bacterium]|nr:nitrous oxide reductase family maturation protein NosD [Crocinitomicaceae bacterium]
MKIIVTMSTINQLKYYFSYLSIFFLLILPAQLFAKTVYVGGNKQFKTIKSAIKESQDGDTIIVTKGVYKEGNIQLKKSLILIGKGNPIVDGQHEHEIFSVKVENVVIKGFQIQNSGRSVMSDPSAIKVYKGAKNVHILNNYLLNNYFGIFVQNTEKVIVKNNVIKATQAKEYQLGNGIHCWKSDSIQVIGNKIFGHRDGIYFEFVTASVIWKNQAHDNKRYGLHFMFAHNNAYISNKFVKNGAGVAVMYTRNIVMLYNVFQENWGDAAYGMLFKELSDCYLTGNKFYRNTTGIFFDGTSRIIIEKNLFKENGWGVRMQANCMDNLMEKNNFVGNTFDITTNGFLTLNKFVNNYWDKYEGFDINKDKIGDVPYRPLSLYSVIVEKNPPAMLLYRSFMIDLLDKSERILPSLTPENFIDNEPWMVPHKI